MDSINQIVGAVLAHLGDKASSGTVVGEPMKVGDVTLVVLSMLSIGMGAGGGEGQSPGGKSAKGPPPGAGLGEGAGGAVKVRPAAVIAFTAEGVEVLPIPAHPGPFEKMVDRVPAVVEMVERARKAVSSA